MDPRRAEQASPDIAIHGGVAREGPEVCWVESKLVWKKAGRGAVIASASDAARIRASGGGLLIAVLVVAGRQQEGGPGVGPVDELIEELDQAMPAGVRRGLRIDHRIAAQQMVTSWSWSHIAVRCYDIE